MADSVTRYQPQTGVTRLPDLVDQLFRESFVLPTFWDRSAAGGMSRPVSGVNLFETPESFILYAALPGMNPENLDVQVSGREISFKGKFEISTPENGNWIWRSIPSSDFYESFTLPVEVEGDKVEASYEHGILTLTLPKAEHLRPKSIKVSVAK